MRDLDDMRLFVATRASDGSGHFVESLPPARLDLPGVVQAAYLWSLQGTPLLNDKVGEVPVDQSFPQPGGVKFALICFPARSAGLLDLSSGAAKGTA